MPEELLEIIGRLMDAVCYVDPRLSPRGILREVGALRIELQKDLPPVKRNVRISVHGELTIYKRYLPLGDCWYVVDVKEGAAAPMEQVNTGDRVITLSRPPGAFYLIFAVDAFGCRQIEWGPVSLTSARSKSSLHSDLARIRPQEVRYSLLFLPHQSTAAPCWNFKGFTLRSVTFAEDATYMVQDFPFPLPHRVPFSEMLAKEVAVDVEKVRRRVVPESCIGITVVFQGDTTVDFFFESTNTSRTRQFFRTLERYHTPPVIRRYRLKTNERVVDLRVRVVSTPYRGIVSSACVQVC